MFTTRRVMNPKINKTLAILLKVHCPKSIFILNKKVIIHFNKINLNLLNNFKNWKKLTIDEFKKI